MKSCEVELGNRPKSDHVNIFADVCTKVYGADITD